MSRRSWSRLILLACTIVFLLALAWWAIAGGARQLARVHSVAQGIETVVQLALGLLSILLVVTCFGWRGIRGAVRGAWGISLVATGLLSALVWGPPMWQPALGFALAALVIAMVVVAALRAAEMRTGASVASGSQ